MKLSNLIIVSFVIFGLVGSLVGGILYYNTGQKLMEEEIGNSLLAISESRADHIDTYLQQNIERFKMFTGKTVLREDIKEYNENPNDETWSHIVKIIKDQKEPIEVLERLCVIGLDGKIIASTDNNLCGLDVSEKEFFINGKKDIKLYFIEDVGKRYIFVSGPFILDGETVGVGITVVNMDVFEEIVKDRTGLGETGEVLVTFQGKDERIYLFERLFEVEALSQDIESKATAEPMKQALLGNELLFKNTLDYRDEPVIAVSQYIGTGNIGLVAKMDRKELIGNYRNALVNNSIIVGIVIIVLSFIIGLFISNLISKPIMKMTDTVNEVTRGKLDVRLGKSGISEVRDLTNSLDRVLASMKLAILRSGITKEDIGIGTKEELLKAKHAAEDRYKILFDTSRDAIMTLAPPTWGFTSGNLAAFKLFGVKDLKEFTALGPGDVSPKYQPNGKLSGMMAKSNIQKAMKDGSVSFDWVHKTVDGKEFFASVLLTKVTIGDSVFLQATVRDVTDSKKDEQELKVFLKGFESSGNSMVMVDYKDMKPHIMKVNKSFTKFYGYTEKEALGKNPKVLKSGKFNKDMYKKLWKDILNPKIGFWTGEITNKNKNGKFVDVMLSISTVFDDNGKPLYFIANHTDVGNANEMRNAHKNLFDDANVMIQQCDGFGKVIDVNKKWLKTLGYSEKSIGKLNLMKIIHPSHRKECMNAFKKVMGGGSVSGIKTVFVAKNGNQIPVIVNASPIREGGKVVSTLGIVEIDYDRKIKKPVKRNIKRVKKKIVKRKVNRSKKRKRRK
jgi:PAS domain S-box-containing protein